MQKPANHTQFMQARALILVKQCCGATFDAAPALVNKLMRLRLLLLLSLACPVHESYTF
jgi:hypothetical protein